MKKILFLSCFALLSCSALLPGGLTFNPANYSYNYETFNKTLDYNDKTYLLNKTNFSNEKFISGSNLDDVAAFFYKKLANNVFLKTAYKNKKGKFLIPFNLNYEIEKEHIDFLSENTNLDYIILSKISYLENLNIDSLSKNNKLRFYDANAGAISSIKIIDIKKNEVFLEVSCAAYLNIREERDLYTGVKEFQPKAIHKNSYSLGEKAMKKLLKKIK